MEPILEIAALKKYYGKEPNLTRALDGDRKSTRLNSSHRT